MVKDFIRDLKDEFKGYNAKTMKKDLLAGLTVTAVALPLALAFGVSCGATAAAGLITAILAGLIIGAFSGGSFQISGPTGAMSVILLVLFQKYGMQGVLLTGVMSGLVLIIAGVLRFGKIVSFIPSPVMSGFTSGIAIIIALGQIDNFLGIHSANSHSAIVKLVGYFTNSIHPNWQAVILGLIVIAAMILWPKKLSKIIPSSLAAIILALLVSVVFQLDTRTIGQIPQTLLPGDRLFLDSIKLSQIDDMIVPALSIAALGMIESLLCGTVGGKMSGKRFNPNRELVAQGIGNAIIPFFGGVPATAAIARSSVGIKSGGVTRMVGIVHSAGLLISMFLLAPVMSKIPLSALAGVLMVTAFRMNEWDKIKYIFGKRLKWGILKYTITMAATVMLDLTQAIVIGVVLSVFMFLLKISEIEIGMEAVKPDKLPGYKGNPEDRDVRVCYITGPIFFPTVDKLLAMLSESGKPDVLILSMRGVPLIDLTGVEALSDYHRQMMTENRRLFLSGLQPNVNRLLKKSGFTEELGTDKIFWSADKAIVSAYEI